MPQYPRVFKNEFGKVTVYRSVFVPTPNTPPRDIYKIRWKQGGGWREEKTSIEQKALDRAEELISSMKRLEELHSMVTKDKLAYYVTCEHLLEGKATLLEVVQDYVKKHQTAQEIQVANAVAAYQASMTARELSKAHVSTVSYRLQKFAKAHEGPLSAINVQKINAYLSKFRDLVSRRNERAVLSRFFTWCQMQGWVDSDTRHVVQKSDTIRKTGRKEPGIIKPDDMLRLLAAAKFSQPEVIPYLALGGFGGLRTEEIARLGTSNIDLERRLIFLSSEVTKTRRRRVVHMSDNLVLWLKNFWPEDGFFYNNHILMKRCRLCKRLGLKWPLNGLRHSYVSYAVELTRDAAHVAEQCGHSLTVLQNTYKSLATPEDAKRWFSIVPSDLDAFRPVQNPG